MGRIKKSVSLAIFNEDGAVLLVKRPADDEDLPNAWGLPAASLGEGESWIEAAKRAGHEKLGVELEVEGELNAGSLERATYQLDMKLFRARIMSGKPTLAHSHSPIAQLPCSHTQYQEWKWGTEKELEPAANAGSLCCRLFLDYKHVH